MRPTLLLLAGFALPAFATEQSGADVYANTCSECHATGKFNAPLYGSARHWKKLIREGLDDLVPTAFVGLRKMPPKGGNPALSDREVARAVIHMANAGGGRFDEPGEADLTRWRQKADKRKKK